MKYILSLAGGGIRGAITVSFLEQLEDYLQKQFQKSIHERFDMFTGSSTGAMISSGLAHEKLTAKELTNKFYTHETAKRLMNKSWSDYIFGLFQTKPKYDGKGKRQVITEIAGERTFDETDKDIMIPLYDITNEEPVFARSWNNPDNLKLVDVLDATSAAPGYFPTVEYKPGSWAIDGSLISHNPSLNAYIEAKKLYPTEKIVVLSVGTGQGFPDKIGRESQNWGAIEWASEGDLFDIFLNAPMEGDTYYMKELVKLNGDKFVHIDGYLRHTEMDDISQGNIDRLKDFGRTLWSQNEESIKPLFNSQITQVFDEELSIL